MDYLPLFFDLKQRPVLLVGGGDVGLRKARLLLAAGAGLRVVSRTLHPQLQRLLEQHQGEWLAQEYQPDSLDGVTLVVAATDDAGLNRQVHDDCRQRNLPVNVVDNPALCTFIVPAIVDRSPLVIGISSGGKAPVLARLLRARLESLIPARYGELGQLAATFREAVRRRFANVGLRRRFWEKVFQGSIAEQVFNGQLPAAQQQLQTLLDSDAEQQPAGEVYLVGAGPGDPELLTFKALRLMQQADVVLYDRLVSPEVLELCRRDAELLYVGKQRSDHSLEQLQINQLLVDKARAGLRVVRLKGGDPFLFGRGGEELQALREAGIAFQVVPGITAANACSAYAGIPLTHRNHAQSVKLITGQLKNRTAELDFKEMVAPNQTLVFYMGLHTLAQLVDGLTRHGKPGDTPIALVSKGSTPQQRVLTGTLDSIVEKQAGAGLQAPVTIIVGEVAALHEQLAWYQPQPAVSPAGWLEQPAGH